MTEEYFIDIDDVKRIIRGALDVPTFIDPVVNCRNLTRALVEIESLITLGRANDNAGKR